MTTPTIGEQILLALQARLKTIKKAAGYYNDIKKVLLDYSEMTLQLSEQDLPSLEIINGPEMYEHQPGTNYWASTDVVLQITAPKSWTDAQMERILTDIRRCLFGGSAFATGNTGATLGGLASGGIRLVDCQPDLNMIQSNRIYMLRIRLRSLRTTYKD